MGAVLNAIGQTPPTCGFSIAAVFVMAALLALFPSHPRPPAYPRPRDRGLAAAQGRVRAPDDLDGERGRAVGGHGHRQSLERRGHAASRLNHHHVLPGIERHREQAVRIGCHVRDLGAAVGERTVNAVASGTLGQMESSPPSGTGQRDASTTRPLRPVANDDSTAEGWSSGRS